MKSVVLWFREESNQLALACKMAAEFPVAAIVFEKPVLKRKYSWKMIASKIFEKLFLREIDQAWFKLKGYYSSSFSLPEEIPVHHVENINSAEVVEWTKKYAADLIVVSGTRLVKQHLFEINPSIGFVNLHTGLSPYIKGGPNCTNWCIANNTPWLIGNTVMWLDKGIDSGNIICNELVALQSRDSLYAIHFKVMEAAHQLYVNAVQAILQHPERVPNVPQKSIAEGVTYYGYMWGLKQKINLIKNMGRLPQMLLSKEYEKKKAGLKLISLPQNDS